MFKLSPTNLNSIVDNTSNIPSVEDVDADDEKNGMLKRVDTGCPQLLSQSIINTSDDEAEEKEALSVPKDQNILEMLADKHRFQDVGKIVHIGIIDYLTSYTCMKKTEQKLKSIGADPKTISVAHPIFYGCRFKSWVIENVFSDTNDSKH